MTEESNNDKNIIYQLSPELLTEIFGNLNINDLFGCALVNRKWSANAMRILWKCPIQLATFPLKNSKSPQEKLCSIISTMAKCLSVEVKNKLSNYGIFIDEIKNQNLPMFDYCLFMEKLNFVMIFKATFFWLNSLVKKGCVTGIFFHHLIFQEICNLVVIKSNIINNQQRDSSKMPEAKIILSAYNPRQMLQGETCNRNYKVSDFPLPSHLPLMTQTLSRLERVTLSTCMQPRFIKELNNICRNILDMSIHCGCHDDQHLADFINNQRKLQKIVMFSLKSDTRLHKIADAIKNKLEQLSSLNISVGQVPLEIFSNKQCDCLIELHLIDCDQPLAKPSDWNQFLCNNTSFKKLKKLELQCNIRNLEKLGIFLQKVPSLRELILIRNYPEEQVSIDKLFRNIANYSSNLIQLELTAPEFTESLEVILQSCKKLEYLNLKDDCGQSNDLNERFSLLAQHFPISLKKFGVEFDLNVSKEKVEKFLNNCFNIGIRKLSLGVYFEEFSSEYEIIMKRHVRMGTLNNEFYGFWLKEQNESTFEEYINTANLEKDHWFDFIRESQTLGFSVTQ
ncbi:hypothetical protein C1645_813426 [Glomus cerebriforme]|uniref:F-box domain-containing protein n=1 Tax=Glomus cerebriforme TaxID=658196 RepID=A0A397TI30_9GLOM|nr:hypothetical protein C1645_813426 [Glomus cerebriforme]